MWCSITKKCEKKCITDFEALEKIDAIHACHFTNDAQFCSNEETCQKALTCPNSIMKGQYLIRSQFMYTRDWESSKLFFYFIFSGIENADPVGYEVVVKDLWVGSVITVQKQNKEKFTIPIKKIVNDEDVYDATLPYAGYKTHEETSYMEDMFVAFRCPTETYALCAQLPFE